MAIESALLMHKCCRQHLRMKEDDDIEEEVSRVAQIWEKYMYGEYKMMTIQRHN